MPPLKTQSRQYRNKTTVFTPLRDLFDKIFLFVRKIIDGISAGKTTYSCTTYGTHFPLLYQALQQGNAVKGITIARNNKYLTRTLVGHTQKDHI
jgi:hypothetical protein